MIRRSSYLAVVEMAVGLQGILHCYFSRLHIALLLLRIQGRLAFVLLLQPDLFGLTHRSILPLWRFRSLALPL